jgi:ABC-type transport system involved in cytochrome c biogenesis permease subunit
MIEDPLARARLRKATLIVLVVTVVAFAAALILRGIADGSFPLLTITYELLGAVAGIGTAFLLVFVPLYVWQEHRKARRAAKRHE